MVRSFKFRSTSVPVGSYEDEIFDTGFTLPSHLSRAKAAIHDLDNLSFESKRHDQAFIDSVNAKAIASAALPTRTHYHARRHHVLPTTNHLSRRLTVAHGDTSDILSRGYSVPPVSHSRTYHIGTGYDPSQTRRLSLAADTVVRQAHREVDRVQRELSYGHHDPITVRRHRSFSFAAPHRASSVYMHEPLVGYHHTHHTPVHHHHHHSVGHHYPLGHHYSIGHSYYPDYHYHPGHFHRSIKRYPSPYLLEEEHAVSTKPLYSSAKLIQCLTDTTAPSSLYHHHHHHTPSTMVRSRSVLPVHVSPLYTPPPLKRSHSSYRSSSYHLPSLSSRSTFTLPESVGKWYYKPLDTLATRYLASPPATASYQTTYVPPVTPVYVPPVAPHVPHVASQVSHVVRRSRSSVPSFHHSAPISVDISLDGHHVDVPQVVPERHHYYHSSLAPYRSHSHFEARPVHVSADHHVITGSRAFTPTELTTYPSLPPRPHQHSSSDYITKAAVLTSDPGLYLHTGLERPLESHRLVSDTRQKVRTVLSKY